MEKIELKIRDRIFTGTLEEISVLKILDRWGLVFSLCDSDLYLMIDEIIETLKFNETEY
jgi:hypothetical protein